MNSKKLTKSRSATASVSRDASKAARSAAVAPTGSLPLTKYHQIYLVLRQQLEEGLHAEGVPPELVLAQEFGVGRVTVRRALEQLVKEGLIVRAVGRGTRPTSQSEQAEQGKDAAQAAHPSMRLSGLLGNIVQVSRSTSIKVVEWSIVRASQSLAQALQVPEGTRIRKIVRTRSLEAGPVSYITSYLPEERVKGITKAQVARRPLLELLEGTGVELGRARQLVSAVQADALVAAELGVALGSALLLVRRLVFDADDRPVQLLHGLYRPDRYEYQMEISQIGGIDARIVASEITPGTVGGSPKLGASSE